MVCLSRKRFLPLPSLELVTVKIPDSDCNPLIDKTVIAVREVYLHTGCFYSHNSAHVYWPYECPFAFAASVNCSLMTQKS